MCSLKITGIISSFVLMVSCNSGEMDDAKNLDPEAIFFDYKIWAEENKPNVTCLLQFRFGGPNGTTLAMNDSTKVEMDGEIVEAASAKLSGVFYEVQKPLVNFSGPHSIVVKASNKKQYKEEFRFRLFTMKTKLPAIIKRSDLIFKLQGLDTIDYLRIVAVDTSFYSEDINQVDTIRNGQLTITIQQLENLANGPIILQLYKEEEKALKNATRRGGKIAVTYGLKREFVLTD